MPSFSQPLGSTKEGPDIVWLSSAGVKVLSVFLRQHQSAEDFARGSVAGEWCRISAHCGRA